MDLEKEARVKGRRLKILVTRLRYLGDVILSTPVLSALKRRYRDAEIHYLAESPYSQVLDRNPYLEGIIRLDHGFGASLSVLKSLRRIGFMAALDLFYNPRSAVLLFLSGIPIRAGGSRRWRRSLYTNNFSVPGEVRSAISHNLYASRVFDVDAADELPRIYLGDDERLEGQDLLRMCLGGSGDGRPVVALHPGGTWPSKRWSTGSFAALARELERRLDARVLIVVGPGESEIGRAVQEEAGGGAFVLPVQPIRRLASVIDRCDAVVANDGGVLHVAVALGRPTVGVFGPTEPDIWFPYEGKGPFTLATRNEDCAPCHLHHCDDMLCLDRIEPMEVMSKVEKVMSWSAR